MPSSTPGSTAGHRKCAQSRERKPQGELTLPEDWGFFFFPFNLTVPAFQPPDKWGEGGEEEEHSSLPLGTPVLHGAWYRNWQHFATSVSVYDLGRIRVFLIILRQFPGLNFTITTFRIVVSLLFCFLSLLSVITSDLSNSHFCKADRR